MNLALLESDIQEFITTHLNTDINTLLLKGTTFPTAKTAEICEQIEAKKRCEKKLPSWFHCTNIYYPNKLNIEQTSSEITAAYKSQLLKGETLIDVTGGFGVDCFYFSKRFKSVLHCETNGKLSQIVTHNYKQLQVENIQTLNTDGTAYLKDTHIDFDCIYIDPSRRHESKGKVFFLKDCLPNVPEHLPLLLEKSKQVLIKTAPLLDIAVGLRELTNVKSIHIVAVNNEVKELLWHLEKDCDIPVTIHSVNLNTRTNSQVTFSYKYEDEKTTIAPLNAPLSYLYEPNAAILKSGAFNQIATQYKCYKLHQHSHLYTHTSLIDFPGRRFKIENCILYNKKLLRKLSIKKANITTRNFPQTVQQLRKTHKIADGGDVYLFFTTNHEDNKIVILCSKI